MKYKVNFINSSYRRFFAQHKKEIVGAFEKCAKYGDFMLRDETRKFEKNLAKYIGVKYAVGVNSCTDAMFLSLKALGIGSGDEVITVSHTFIATIQAIIHTGATPVLVDVGTDELIDVWNLEQKITPKTKAILLVHFHGRICNTEEIMRMAKKHHLYVVEDAAQALGSSQNGKKAGSFGDTGCFSFNFPKLMGAYGDAGAIVTNNESLYKKLLLLRNHWNITQGSVRQKDYPQPKIMGWGWKSRIDNIQAAILNVKFKYLPQILKKRKQIERKYNEALRKFFPHKVFFFSFAKTEYPQEYVIRIEDRNGFKKFMEKKKIELLIRDTIPNHKLEGLNLEHFNLPETEILAQTSVRLPIYPELVTKEVNYIIKSLIEYFNDKK